MTDNTQHDDDTALVGRKTAESIIWFTALPFALQIVRFVNSILLARILSPRDFGIIGIASVIVFYCNNLSNFGLGNAIVQRKDIRIDHINTFFTFNLAISVVLCLAFVLAANSIASFFNIAELSKVMIFFSFMFIITSIHTMGYTKLRRELAFRSLALNEATKTISSMAISLPLALLGFQYWSMLIAVLASNIIATITISFRARFVPRLAVSRESFRELFSFASWNFFSMQIRLLSEYVDKLIVGKVLGAIPLGYYEKSFGISQMPNENIGNKIGTVVFSTFSQCQNNKEDIHYYFVRTFTVASFLLFPIYFGLFAVADTFVLALLGEKWQTMIPSFRILLAAFLLASLSTVFSTVNVTCGKYREDTRIRLFCLLLLAPCLVIAANYGIEAVAAMILLHNVLFFFCSLALAQRSFSLPVAGIAGGLIPAFAGAGLMVVLIFTAKRYLFVSSEIMSLAALVCLGAFWYGAWFLGGNFGAWRFMKGKLRSVWLGIQKRD